MNCRSFEYQVADWIAGRLPRERAQGLADHRQSCASCAAIAEAEERLREGWRSRPASPAPDFWPRLSLRLEDQRSPQGRPWPAAARRGWAWRGWAWGGTAVLAAMALGSMLLWPKPLAQTERTPGGQLVMGHSSSAVSVLPDVSRVDPAVDDPAGRSMENVWTQINTTAFGVASQ